MNIPKLVSVQNVYSAVILSITSGFVLNLLLAAMGSDILKGLFTIFFFFRSNLIFWIVMGFGIQGVPKTLPEAQRTQGIESIT